MHVQPFDLGAPFHLGIGGAQHRGHMKNVRDAVALEHVGEALRPGHFAVVADLHVSVFLIHFLVMLRESGASSIRRACLSNRTAIDY